MTIKVFISYIRKTKNIRWLFLGTFSVIFLSTWVWQLGLLILLGIGDHHGRQFYSILMLVHAASCIGMSLLIPLMTKRLTRNWYALGVIFWGMGLLPFAIFKSLLAFYTAVIIIGMGRALISQSRIYILQTTIPKDLMGQGFSFSATLFYLANFLSFSLFAVLVSFISTTTIFFLTSALIIIIGLFLLRSHLKTLFISAPTYTENK